MVPPPSEARLKWLEANADRPEVQELIRHEIARGTIQVIPVGGGGIRVISVRGAERSTREDSRGRKRGGLEP